VAGGGDAPAVVKAGGWRPAAAQWWRWPARVLGEGCGGLECPRAPLALLIKAASPSRPTPSQN
jgi:hypothetical protein